MLVLSRRPGDTVVIDGSIKVTVIELRGNTVRLGIEAPEDVRVQRHELALELEHYGELGRALELLLKADRGWAELSLTGHYFDW